jgi:hypothetical protein
MQSRSRRRLRTAPRARGIHVKKVPFADVTGFTVPFPAALKSTIGSLAALALN